MNTNDKTSGNEQFDVTGVQHDLQGELRKLRDSFPESKDKFELGQESGEYAGITVREDPEKKRLREEGKALEYLARLDKRKKEISEWLLEKEKAADMEAAAKRRARKIKRAAEIKDE